jgi:hypothetical protein
MPPLPKKVLSNNISAKEAMMSPMYGIGDAVRKLYAKLADSLAGPLQQLLPTAWIDQTLREIGHRFRQTAFSPSGDAVGLHRAGA